MTFYVYILYSEKFDKYYVGHTDDYEARLFRHNNTKFKNYTYKYRPWILAACFEAGKMRKSAMDIEKKIKNLKSKVMLMRIIESQLPDFLSEIKRII